MMLVLMLMNRKLKLINMLDFFKNILFFVILGIKLLVLLRGREIKCKFD